MSEIFHKSCYTARSSGYKYRTLSTNTGDKKRRDSRQDNVFERKMRELKREICTRIETEMDKIEDARENILNKFDRIDAKINSVIELHDTVILLRKDILAAEQALTGMIEKVLRMEAIPASEPYSLRSKKSSFRSQDVILEERELSQTQSTMTHV